MTKLIAIDLDGTLLNSKSQISTENLEAIKNAQNAGIEVVIATGRAHFDVQALFKNSGVKTWIIGANGATIHAPDGSLYYSQPIEPELAYDILRSLEEDGYYYEVFSEECIFTSQNGRELLQIEIDRMKSANPEVNSSSLEEALVKQFSQTGFCFIDSYKDIKNASAEIYNILAFSFFEEKLETGWAKYGNIDGLTIVSSAHHNFELEHCGASKGNALRRLSDKLDIPIAKTIAIGDSMNDVSMLKLAGKGIAMGNARLEVKEISDEITLTNDEHGVAKILLSELIEC
ncbi:MULTISPECIES: Cof-type HAD-IIB family hydrolase [Metabacillus]|uniref:Phosphatase n=2 Tax=Metabacillus TaxID=2675233 RepID=A0A179T2R0_9BACI|nr:MULTISPECIES: Cof-type HAD-IIB family hydrolase [Metabacillus]OAS88307.1 phosphatase [Metabacillus litoralis]QNF28033.1 Cof-type HAD-IIB family hydrolase [Metabacillus sp. KUDC1714]